MSTPTCLKNSAAYCSASVSAERWFKLRQDYVIYVQVFNILWTIWLRRVETFSCVTVTWVLLALHQQAVQSEHIVHDCTTTAPTLLIVPRPSVSSCVACFIVRRTVLCSSRYYFGKVCQRCGRKISHPLGSADTSGIRHSESAIKVWVCQSQRMWCTEDYCTPRKYVF